MSKLNIRRSAAEILFRTVCICSFLALLASLSAAVWAESAEDADEAKMEMKVMPPRVYLGETCRLEIRVKNAEVTRPPNLDYLKDEFYVKYVGSEPFSHSVRFTMGGRTRSSSETGEVFVWNLTPKNRGKIQVDPPKVRSSEGPLTADPVMIEVIAPEDKDWIRLETTVEPQNVYPSLPFRITLSVYVKEQKELEGDDPVIFSSLHAEPPLLSIPWAFDRNLPSGYLPETEWSEWLSSYLNRKGGFSVNGVTEALSFSSLLGKNEYLTFLPHPNEAGFGDTEEKEKFRCYRFTRTIIPEHPGKITFDPSSLKGDFVRYDDNGKVRKESVFVTSNPITVTVKDIPEEERPENYVGAFGVFRLDSELSPKTVKTGEAMTLTLTLLGEGSVLDAYAPNLENKEEITKRFKVYPPTEQLVDGGIKWSWTLRPLAEGTEPFPALDVCYFDIKKCDFVTLSTEAVPITIEKGNGVFTSEDNSKSETELEENTNLPSGIYANLPVGKLEKTRSLRWWTAAGSAVYTAAILFCGTVLLLRRRARMAGQRRADKLREGEKLLRSALSLPAGERESAVTRAFLIPLSDCFEARIEAVTHGEAETVLHGLADRFSADSETSTAVQDVRNLLERMENARYGAEQEWMNEEEVNALYQRWERALKRLPAAGKKKGGKVAAALLLLLLLPTGTIDAASPENRLAETERLFEEAEKSELAEEEKKDLFRQSALAGEEVLREGYENGAFLYNLGNAYFRAGDEAHALASWRRAEKYIPGNDSLSENIAAVQPESSKKRPLIEYLLFWQNFLSWRGKGVLFLLFSVIGSVLLAVSVLVPPAFPLKMPFRRGGALVLFLAAGFYASLCYDSFRYDRNDHAITADSDTVVRKGTDLNYEPVCDPLPKLTECRILETRDDWLRVRLGDGETGWVESEKIVRW